jgi:hypothetical protein
MRSCDWAWVGLGCWLGWAQLSGCSEPLQSVDGSREREVEQTSRGGSSGAGGERTSSGGTEARDEWLGRSCQQDDDCGGSLRCLKSTEDYEGGVGAPAGGLCTSPCTTDSDCSAFADAAVCGTLSEAPLDRAFASEPVPRLCLLGCSLGSPGGSAKCDGRVDLACRPFAPVDAEQCAEDKTCPNGGICYRDRCRELACGPRCNANSDCSDGRFCNPQTGLCDHRPTRHVPVGASCNGDIPGGIKCGDGTCLVLFDSEGVREKGLCTQSCTLGQLCGEGEGACVLPRFKNYAAGDIAYCVERCNCDGECSNREDSCLSWESAVLSEHYGSEGYCGTYRDGDTPLKCP